VVEKVTRIFSDDGIRVISMFVESDVNSDGVNDSRLLPLHYGTG
jgi:hypothetical protein